MHGRVLRVKVESLTEDLVVLDIEEWRLLEELIYEFFLSGVLVASESISLLCVGRLKRSLHERIADTTLCVIDYAWRAWSAVVLAVKV